jgi:hypothetical protein
LFSAFGNEAFLPDYVLRGEDLNQNLGGGGFPRDTPEQCQAGREIKELPCFSVSQLFCSFATLI